MHRSARVVSVVAVTVPLGWLGLVRRLSFLETAEGLHD